MLIPKPVANQRRNSVTARFAQLNMNSAAMAPMCRSTSTSVVGQFSFCFSGNSRSSILGDFWEVAVGTILSR